jgi:hypothetical protein
VLSDAAPPGTSRLRNCHLKFAFAAICHSSRVVLSYGWSPSTSVMSDSGEDRAQPALVVHGRAPGVDPAVSSD